MKKTVQKNLWLRVMQILKHDNIKAVTPTFHFACLVVYSQTVQVLKNPERCRSIQLGNHPLGHPLHALLWIQEVSCHFEIFNLLSIDFQNLHVIIRAVN